MFLKARFEIICTTDVIPVSALKTVDVIHFYFTTKQNMPAFACLRGGLRHAVATLQRGDGGEGGIRTLGTLASTTVFETVPFDHSGTSP